MFFYSQVLETDQVKLRARPVETFSHSPYAGQPRCAKPGFSGSLSLLLRRALRRSGLAPLGLAQPGPFPLVMPGQCSFFQSQRRGDNHTLVDTTASPVPGAERSGMQVNRGASGRHGQG